MLLCSLVGIKKRGIRPTCLGPVIEKEQTHPIELSSPTSPPRVPPSKHHTEIYSLLLQGHSQCLMIYQRGVPLLIRVTHNSSWTVNRTHEGNGCFGVLTGDGRDTDTESACGIGSEANLSRTFIRFVPYFL